MSLEERVREQAEKVRKMKAEKAPKDQVKITLEEWLSWQQPVVHKWCIEKQGGIKCGNRGTGFLDSEGSHR